MKSVAELVQQYRQLLERGANLEIIDNFYDDQIIQIENDQIPIVGKQKLRETEECNLSKVSSFQQQITTLLVDESQHTVMGEMTIQFVSKQGDAQRLNQAFVQKWKDGKILYQRFYYKGFVPDRKV